MSTSTTAADTIASVVPFLQALGTEIMTIAHTDPATVAKVQAAMTGVQQGITALATSDTAAQSQPIVQRIQADATAVLSVAASLPLPPPYGTILMIVSSLLSSVLGVVNSLMAARVTVPVAAKP